MSPDHFDLLPFDLLVANEALREPYLRHSESAPLAVRDDYAQLLQEAIENDQENEHPAYRPMKLLQIVDARVPADAWDKLHRRLHLLECATAAHRQSNEGRIRGRH